MTTVNTQISDGYIELIKIFFNANELDVAIEEYKHTETDLTFLRLSYEENSDTAYQITFMSVRHLGFENMLCDYLIRCGISPGRINLGRQEVKRDMNELDEQWQKYRRQLGFR